MTRARPVFISITEAATLLSVSPRTITRYVDQGYLEAGALPHGQVRLKRLQVLGLVRNP